ncbi:MAG: hypothetical protein ACKVQS_01160 [Fimbriimonadaceae bacterium]
MIAAILSALTSAQLKPAERLTQFLSSALDRSVTFEVQIENEKIDATLSYQSPNLQYMSFSWGGLSGEFFQSRDRVLISLPKDKTYYEYKGFPAYVTMPPESELPASAYPGFLHAWSKKDGLKDAVSIKVPEGADSSLDWFKLSVTDQMVKVDYFVGVQVSGEPKQVLMTAEGSPSVQISLLKFGWPEKDMRLWKYQPPAGFMIGNAPKLHRPYQAGNKVEWGKWVDGRGQTIDMNALNSAGVAVVFLSADGTADQSFLSALPDLKDSLEKMKVKLVEVHLDSKSAPKRDWPVTLDTDRKIVSQFDPPYTPYIFFVRKDRFVIGGWAGYGPDQKANLLKTAHDLYNPSTDE